MNNFSKCFISALLGLWSVSCGADSPGIPWVKDSTVKVYNEKYRSGVSHKAFAIAKTGAFAWVSKRDFAERAAQHALYYCFKAASQRCFLYAVDDKVTIDSYMSLNEEITDVLGKLKVPTSKVYGQEDRENNVAPIVELKKGTLHEPTPTTIPFAKTVTTSELVEMMVSEKKPVILDVLSFKGDFRKDVIPSAHWVIGPGSYDEARNGEIDAFLLRLMTDIAPDKKQPVVVYCLNWECWLSYNTLQRLSRQGYTELYWYRGGIESWQSAGLPTIKVPITAVVVPPAPAVADASSVIVPGSDVPKECAVYSGRWSGEWQRGGIGRVPMVVTSIDKECNATINYAGLNAQTKISGGKLQDFICNTSTGGYCSFKISEDGKTLDAWYWNWSGGRNNATYSRAE